MLTRVLMRFHNGAASTVQLINCTCASTYIVMLLMPSRSRNIVDLNESSKENKLISFSN